MQVHIHPLVTIYINTLLAWAKCFLATYGVYPGLYDLLDTPRHDFLAAQLHLRDSTLPGPLLHQSRGPPTIRSEYVALQPHLAPSPQPDHLYVCHTTCLSFSASVCCATSPSVLPPTPPICLSPQKSVALSVRHTDSPSVIPAHPSYEPSIHPPVTPSMTRQSATPPISLTQCQSDRPSPSDCLHTIRPAKRPSHHPSPSDRLYTILPHPSGCDTSSDQTSMPPSHHLYDTPTSLSDHLPPSHHLYDTPISPCTCPSPADCLTATTTRPPVCPSSPRFTVPKIHFTP